MFFNRDLGGVENKLCAEKGQWASMVIAACDGERRSDEQVVKVLRCKRNCCCRHVERNGVGRNVQSLYHIEIHACRVPLLLENEKPNSHSRHVRFDPRG